MGAARLEPHAQQRRAPQRLFDLEVRARVAPVIGVDRHARAMATVAPDRRVDRAGARGRPTVDQRAVLAHDLARRERAAQPPVHLVVLGDHQQPRGVTVQTVHDARPPGLLAPPAPSLRQRLRERPGCGGRPPEVHDDPQAGLS